ncbi:MAG: hypothetical protein QOK05_588 [Chloroflexota bacterium]|nr:hypothetical protein [Chloroflexota bacterium]
MINRDYQRMPGVWPLEAQSFLIETILLGYPIPKLTLYEHTDLGSRKTITELVDGQQRATAIQAFFKNELRLSKSLEAVPEAAGQTYESLESDLQSRFITYGLGFDSLVDTSPTQIREVFRRINSYEMPLNYEEQRHARFQGAFKWLVYRLARNVGEDLKRFGTFSEANLVRMADMKIIAEIAHAVQHGITTTNKKSLDDLYKDFEKTYPDRAADFPFGEELTRYVQSSIDYVAQLDAIWSTTLAKQYSMYSLLLAVVHARFDVPTLQAIGTGGRGLGERLATESKLGQIAALLEYQREDIPAGANKRLYDAFDSRTNVRDQRLTRATAFLSAVSA